jgi:F-box-like
MQGTEGHWARYMLTPETPKRNDLVPFEVLGEIFSYISRDGPLQLRHTVFVCRLWYHSVVNHPKLWCKIALDEAFYRRFPRRPMLGRGEHFLELCVLRSGDLPLHLVVSGRHLTLNSLVRLSHISNALRLLAQWQTPSGGHAVSHLESIRWQFGDDEEEISLFRTHLPAQLPNLKVLSIRSLFFQNHIYGAGVLFSQCPKLEEVHLVDHFEERPYFPDGSFARVGLLEYTGSSGRGWSWYDVVCLGRFAALHTLVLRDVTLSEVPPRRPKPEAFVATQIELVRLRVLRTIGRIPSIIFCHLDAPALQTLQFQSNASGCDSLATFGTPSMIQNVQNLYISIVDSRNWQGDREQAKQIEELLSACVLLERVYASIFIHERLRIHPLPVNVALLLAPDLM